MEPQRSQWLTFYELADQFLALSPWKWMEDSRLFGVENAADGSVGWCSVMGMMGELRGLAVYRGSEGMESFKLLSTPLDGPEPAEMSFRMNCLILMFHPRAEAARPDLELAQRHGWVMHSAWIPSLRSFIPGYASDVPDAAELEYFNTVLGQALYCCLSVAEDPAWLETPPDAPAGAMRVRLTRDGEWQDRWQLPLSPAIPFRQLTFDATRTAEIRQKRQVPGSYWLLETLYMPSAIEPPPGERAPYPRVALLLNLRDQQVLTFEIYLPQQDPESLAPALLQALARNAYRPERIVVAHADLFAQVRELIKACGIEIGMDREMDIRQHLREALFGGGA